MTKVLINSLGCPKNLVDSEIIAKTLTDFGYTLTSNIDEAEIALINTCSFIEPAVKEAIDVILETSKKKNDKNSSLKKIVVTGCLVERYKEQIITSIPEVDICVGIDGYNDIAQILKSTDEKVILGPKTDTSFMNKSRLLSDNLSSTYVKISEGCDNHCTYCTIPSIRGKFRSRTIEDILIEVNDLCKNGIKEITLVAQDTTAYGKDIYGKPSLYLLLQNLNKVDNLKWIRMLYCYPELITDELILTIKSCEKVLHYIDMPLQHSSNRILKLMARHGSKEQYTILINKLRKEIPDIILRSTFIVGFPQETENDFDDLCDFLSQTKFDRVGFFEYFKEDGTAAYKISGHLPKKTKTKRRIIAEKIQQDIVIEKNKDRLGKIYSIIIQGVSEDGLFYTGRSYAEAYEIDPLIYVSSKEKLTPKDIVDCKIVAIDKDSLIAEVI